MNVFARIVVPVLTLTALLAGTSMLRADELDDLRARFQSREPALNKLKAANQIGETFQGYLELPGGPLSSQNQSLLDQENADRKRLYTLLAQKESTTPELVADRAARRNFSRARSGESLKFPDNVWRKKA